MQDSAVILLNAPRGCYKYNQKMPARKRGRQEADLDDNVVRAAVPAAVNDTLTKLRNMWEFSAFMQYLFLFGKVVKVDEDFDMDVSLLLCCMQEHTFLDRDKWN